MRGIAIYSYRLGGIPRQRLHGSRFCNELDDDPSHVPATPDAHWQVEGDKSADVPYICEPRHLVDPRRCTVFEQEYGYKLSRHWWNNADGHPGVLLFQCIG